MKKLLLFSILCLFLSSCQNNDTSETQRKQEQYIKHYEEVIENTIFSSRNAAPFDISVAMNLLGDGTYRYDIIIDNPRVSMYNIEIIAIENNVSYQNATKLMPTFGIFDSSSYNMIPYQTNVDNGYVKGIIVSGITSEQVINLKIKVTWTDYSRVESSKIFIELEVNFNNQDSKNKEVVDDVTEDDDVILDDEE